MDAHHLLPTRPTAGCVAPWSYLVCTNQSHQKCFQATPFQHKLDYRLAIPFFTCKQPQHSSQPVSALLLFLGQIRHQSQICLHTLQMTSFASPARDCWSHSTPAAAPLEQKSLWVTAAVAFCIQGTPPHAHRVPFDSSIFLCHDTVSVTSFPQQNKKDGLEER